MEGYTIAMHGYHHTFCSKAHGILNKRINSEFAGLPYNIQYEIIRDGKAILESHNIYTNIFLLLLIATIKYSKSIICKWLQICKRR